MNKTMGFILGKCQPTNFLYFPNDASLFFNSALVCAFCGMFL